MRLASVSLNPPRNGEGDRAKRGGGGAPSLCRPEVSIARRLRRDMSPPEVLLWERLRGKRAGLKFRRQHPIGPYVVDFYCAEYRTAVEVDGEAHDRGIAPTRDLERDAFIAENGVKLIRIAASHVLADPDAIADALVALVAPPLPHLPEAANGPPPRAGED